MCGRYTLQLGDGGVRELARHCAAISQEPQVADRFNIAPGQECLAVRQQRDGVRTLELLWWGFAGQAGGGRRCQLNINARAETVAEKWSFRDAFAQRRCLIPATGYYEWTRSQAGTREPWLIRPRGEVTTMAMAGIWQPRETGEQVQAEFAVLTVAANPAVAALHHRMPMVLAEHHFSTWLNPALSTDAGHTMQGDAQRFVPESRRVGRYVNSARNEGPECVRPRSPQQQQSLPF